MALTPFSSQLIADIGISTGDEGKGRLIYEVAQELREQTHQSAPLGMVLKVNGGANSGHTAGGLKHNLVPAGVVDPTISHLAIGSGVVADPRKLWWEIRPLGIKGHQVLPRLLIDERTMVSDVTHRLLDLAWEYYRTHVLREEPRGSTGRGITPAYLDEVGQWPIYYGDFRRKKDAFARKMLHRVDRAVRVIQHVCRVDETNWFKFFELLTRAELKANADAIAAGVFPPQEFDFGIFRTGAPFQLNVERLIEVYWRCGEALLPQIGDVRETCLRLMGEGRYILGEFGQAYWLDKRQGFTPNVTASHTYTPELFLSAGLPVQPVHVLGVAKAYDTKVGTHVFLTQMDQEHPLGQLLRLIEYGTSTGRQRMVGWFDAVEKGDALRYAGYHDMMINKLDALTHRGAWQGDLRICTSYEDESGRRYAHVPRDDGLRRCLRPVYENWPGWSEEISGVRHFADLPRNARRYVAAMVRATIAVANEGGGPRHAPNLRYVGVGPEPSQIIKDIPATADLLRELA